MVDLLRSPSLPPGYNPSRRGNALAKLPGLIDLDALGCHSLARFPAQPSRAARVLLVQISDLIFGLAILAQRKR
jgi:hypothetical protein